MHESCLPRCAVGDANGSYAAWHPAMRATAILHVPALCTEHAWGQIVVQTRVEIMESPMMSVPQRCVERVGSTSDADGRPRLVLQDTQRAFERKDYD